MKRKTIFGKTIGALALAGAVLDAQAAVSLSLSPAAQTAAPGDSIELMLIASGLTEGGAPSLGAFDLILNYDPSILAYSGVVFGDMLGPVFGAITFEFDDGLGALNLAAVSLDDAATLDALQPGAFELATITFLATGAGVSPVAIDAQSVILGDALGAPLELGGLENASVAVSEQNAVPEVPAPGLAAILAAIALAVRKQLRTGAAN